MFPQKTRQFPIYEGSGLIYSRLMPSKKSVTVGGKDLANLLRVERLTVLERSPGKGFLSGVIKVNRSGTLYLLIPVKVRDALNIMGIDLRTFIGRKDVNPEVIITTDENGDELRLEYSFKKKVEEDDESS